MHGSNSAVFDWYAATVDVFPDMVWRELAAELGAEVREARGLHGYPAGKDFVRAGDVVAKMIYGGEASPHVWASGADAPDLARVLRALWPWHYVTRCDVAYDFLEGEPWQPLYEAAVTVADYLESGEPRRRPLRLATIGDWVREDEGYPGGRTLYVGSMKSPVMARLYEKGKQMRALYPDQLDKYAAGWVRLELQVRPEGDARREVARLEPAAIWGTARWSRELHSRVFSSELSPVLMARHRPADDDRAWRALLSQYGPLLRRRVDQVAPTGLEARQAAYQALGLDLFRALG